MQMSVKLAQAVCNMHITLLLIAPCGLYNLETRKEKKESWCLNIDAEGAFHLAILHTSWIACICFAESRAGLENRLYGSKRSSANAAGTLLKIPPLSRCRHTVISTVHPNHLPQDPGVLVGAVRAGDLAESEWGHNQKTGLMTNPKILKV